MAPLTFDPLTAPYRSVFRPTTFKGGVRGIFAEHPELPGCSVDIVGLDYDEARRVLEIARLAYIQSMLADNLDVPPPLAIGQDATNPATGAVRPPTIRFSPTPPLALQTV